MLESDISNLVISDRTVPTDVSSASRVPALTTAGFQVLLALASGHSRGYAVIGFPDQLTDGQVRLGPGTLYRTLAWLVADELVSESDANDPSAPHDARRRYYSSRHLVASNPRGGRTAGATCGRRPHRRTSRRKPEDIMRRQRPLDWVPTSSCRTPTPQWRSAAKRSVAELIGTACPTGGCCLSTRRRPRQAATERRDQGAECRRTFHVGRPTGHVLLTGVVDSAFAHAAEMGAAVEMPVAEMLWGDRYGIVRDPFGHHWSLCTRRELLARRGGRPGATRADRWDMDRSLGARARGRQRM